MCMPARVSGEREGGGGGGGGGAGVPQRRRLVHDGLERLGDDRRPVHVTVLRLVDLAHHRTGTCARGGGGGERRAGMPGRLTWAGLDWRVCGMSRQGWAEARVAASLVAVRAAAGWVAATVVEVTVAMTTVEAGTAVGAVAVGSVVERAVAARGRGAHVVASHNVQPQLDLRAERVEKLRPGAGARGPSGGARQCPRCLQLRR